MISPNNINRTDDNKESTMKAEWMKAEWMETKEEKWTTTNKKEWIEVEENDREKILKSIETPIKTINDKIFKLLSNHNDLLYDIKDKIKNISQKENQLFIVCGIIAWETEKYFKIRYSRFYEEKVKNALSIYIYWVNLAKQNLDTAKFCEFYNDFVKKIEESEAEKPNNYNKFSTDKIFYKSL